MLKLFILYAYKNDPDAKICLSSFTFHDNFYFVLDRVQVYEKSHSQDFILSHDYQNVPKELSAKDYQNIPREYQERKLINMPKGSRKKTFFSQWRGH